MERFFLFSSKTDGVSVTMVIQGMRYIRGPNVFHSKPVSVMTLDLGKWAGTGSHELPGFKEKLQKALPGISKHTCSPGYPGGFLERLERGTYLAHIIEHVAIELCDLAGMSVTFGKTKYTGQFGVYDVVVRSLNESATDMALRSAVDLVESLLAERDLDIPGQVRQIEKSFRENRLGPSAQSLLDAATRRNIPWELVGLESLLQLGYGKHRRRLQAAVSDGTSLIAAELVQDKQITKTLLDEAGVPVPVGNVVRTLDEALNAFEKMKSPCVVKPVDGHHGFGVTLNLNRSEDVRTAFEMACEQSPTVLIEEMCPGRDFRVLIVGGRFVACAERFPPVVIGDGESKVSELVDKLNRDPRRGDGHQTELTRVEVDGALLETLRRQGFSLDAVAEKNQRVFLRENANLSSGGTSKDVTDHVHPEVRSLCERIARIFDLDICGVDLVAQSLALPVSASGLKVIEVNAGPGLRMHLAPTEGQSRPVNEEVLNLIYPPGSPSRIPIVAVTGTNGKTTCVRLIQKIMSDQYRVGMTTSDGIYIGPERILVGDTTGPVSARQVLSDPSVDLAILEVARGGVLRKGLAYDWSDVGIITNIREDHIGQDGIETLEDLVWIKSLVAERVKEGGTLILNADDELSLSLKDMPRISRIQRRRMLYSVHARNPELLRHLEAGGDGAWCEDGWLFLKVGGEIQRLVSTQNMKFTFEGRADFQVSNALAAVCGASALGARTDQIVTGLMSFQSSSENQGRLNLYKVRGGYVILDYGHNPDAISALGELISGYPGYSRTAIFGLPGDRSDEIILKSAEKIATYFDRLVARDDQDLRGRKPGEVPEIVRQVVEDKFPGRKFSHALTDREAIESVLDHIREGDIVLILFDSLETFMPLLRQYDPTPALAIPPLPGTTPRQELKEMEWYELSPTGIERQ